jgi:CubicO group peptidase (beta-lactamase class C family)
MTSDYFKDLDKRSSTRFLSGGGGLLSTPADYIKFARMLANKGELNGKRILKSTTVEMMTVPTYIKDIERHISVFGQGWFPGFMLQVAPDITATTGGGHNGLYWIAGAANLFFWVDPATNIVAMVWAQSLPFMVYPIFDDTRKVVHQAFNDAKH